MAEKVTCPNCLSENVQMTGDILYCRTCNLTGDLKAMKFCERAPVFNPVANPVGQSGQLYKRGEQWWVLMGHAPGCGRPVTDYCHACRPFMPEIAQAPVRKSKRKEAQEDAASA